MRFPSLLLPLAGMCIIGSADAKNQHPLKWAEKPTLHVIPDSLKKESAVVILDERRVELVTPERAEPEQYRSVHRIVRVLDEKGVSSFNTYSIPIAGDEMTEIKARTILPDGRVITVAPGSIKQIKNEEGQQEYKIALEGVEKGAEIELLYCEKRYISSFGMEVFQYGVPGLQAEFSLIVPQRLGFEGKGYNGFSAMADTVYDDLHHYTASSASIPVIRDETYSRYRPHLQRLDYKLSYVDGENANVRKQTWADLAKALHNNYRTFSDKEMKVVRKLLNTMGVNEADDEMKKLITIEDYLKTNISMSSDIAGDEALEFSYIVSKKLTRERGFVRLMAACLEAANVNYEIGVMAGRYNYPMDDTLEMWDHLDIYAMYFPKLRKYIAPTAVTYRYPFVPALMCDDRGLFTKTTRLGNMVSAVPEIRTIPHAPSANSALGITADVSFAGEDMLPTVRMTNTFLGNGCDGFISAFLFGDKSQEKKLIQSIVHVAENETDIEKYTVENTAFSNYTTGKPLLVNSVVRAPKLIEKAGPKYVFKLGDLIGRQTELYNENKRVLPVEVDYPHSLPRTLRIQIPEGFTVANPQDVKLHVVYQDGGKELCGFKSDYVMEGNTLVVNILEYYDQMSIPVSGYETFRKVINAAADFNKVVLVLQKS